MQLMVIIHRTNENTDCCTVRRIVTIPGENIFGTKSCADFKSALSEIS